VLNANLKSTAIILIIKILLYSFFSNHISHNFTIHIDMNIRRLISL